MSTNERKGFWRRFLFAIKFLEIRLRFVAILIVTALVVGYWDTIQNHIERWQRNRMSPEEKAAVHAGDAHAGEFEFYCPMHPFVVRNQPAKCPICGMDLSKREKGEATVLPEGVLARVQVAPERIMQAGVKVEPAVYRLLSYEIRSYGIVETDETRESQIIARFPGRVEQLYVNAEGMEVKKGDPLAQIYSPRFLAAAQEYVQALAAERQASGDAEARRRAAQLSDYARQRLKLAGFTDEQLNAIAEKGQAEERVTLYSPLSGTVLQKSVLLGDAVEEGTQLYRIADLSTVWVQALIAEGDIAQVKLGQSVEVTTVSRPGEMFFGQVDFIYPTINPESRSAKVRIVVSNENGALKPGMYATTVIRSAVGEVEEIGPTTPTRPTSPTSPASLPTPTVQTPTTTPEQAAEFMKSVPPGGEYWDCPMHPEVVSEKKADCPKCGMFLVQKTKEAEPERHAAHEEQPATAASATSQWAEGWACPMHLPQLVDHPGICPIDACGMEMKHWRIERVLSIPETAVIDTGRRYVVYIESMPGVYDAKEVKLGRRAGVYYPVREGLELGQKIVTNGSFLIDAEARLNPSVSSAGDTTAHQH